MVWTMGKKIDETIFQAMFSTHIAMNCIMMNTNHNRLG